MGDGCPPADAPFGACMGGMCANGSCVCPKRFTGVGDFVYGAGTQCTVYIPVVTALWALMVFAYAVQFCLGLAFAHVTYFRRSSRSKSRIGLLVMVSSGFFIVAGSLRVARPTSSAIGTDVATTFMFCQGAALLWTYMIYLEQATLGLHLALSPTARVGQILSSSGEKLWWLVLNVAAVLCCELPLVMLAFPDAKSFYIIGCMYQMGLGACALFLGSVLFPYLASPIITELRSALARKHRDTTSDASRTDVLVLETLIRKLEGARKEVFVQGWFNFVVGGAIGLWPFTQHLFSYWLPIAFSLGSMAMSRGLYLELPTRKGGNSKSSEYGRGGDPGSTVHMMLAQSSMHGEASQFRITIMTPEASGLTATATEAVKLIEDGDILSDDHGIVNVVANHTQKFDVNDTLLGRFYPELNRQLYMTLRHWMAMGTVAVVGPLVALTGIGIGIAVATLTARLPSVVALFFLLVVFLYLSLVACFLNLTIARKCTGTAMFWIRTISATVSFFCMSIVLRDFRIMSMVALYILQIFVAFGDATAGELAIFRIVFLVQLFVQVLLLVLGIYLELIPYTYATVALSSGFDWALIQLARDLWLGTLLVVIFDLWFALRGSSRRFNTIHDPVKFSLLEFKDDDDEDENEFTGKAIPTTPPRRNRGVNASRLQLKSGFLAASQTTDDANAKSAHIRIFVDTICIRQMDCLACHVFGRKLGIKLFELCDDSAGQLIDAAAGLLLGVSVFASPWLSFTGYLCIPFIIVHSSRRLLTSSKSMLVLICSRRQFLVQFLFVTLWFSIWCTVFTDASVLPGAGLYVMSVGELLKDASVRTRSLVKVLNYSVQVLMMAITFASYMVVEAYPVTQHFYIDFRPDLHYLNGTDTPYSDQASVVDIYQQVVDLLISLFLGQVVLIASHVHGYRSDQLTTISVPIVPVFVVGDDRNYAPNHVVQDTKNNTTAALNLVAVAGAEPEAED